MKKKIELEIPVEIYTELSDKIDELEKSAEKRMLKMEKEIESLKKSVERFMDSLESRFMKDMRSLERKVEKRLSELEQRSEKRMEEKIRQFESSFSDLEKSVEESFNEEASYVKSLLEKFSEKLSIMSQESKESIKVFTKNLSELRRLIKAEVSETKKSLKDQIRALEKEHKNSIRDMSSAIKAIDKRLEFVEREIGESEVLKKKRRIRKSVEALEKKIEKSGPAHASVQRQAAKRKSAAGGKSLKIRIPGFLSGIMKQRADDKEPSNKWISKISSIRRRKTGKAFVIGVAKTLREYLLKKFGIKEKLTYMETIEELEKRGVDKKVLDQIQWFFEEVNELEYSNEDSEERFPDIDTWASKIILYFESKMVK